MNEINVVVEEGSVNIKVLEAIGEPGTKGADGYTPRKGVDYFDGGKGADGARGADGAKGDKGDTGDPYSPTPPSITHTGYFVIPLVLRRIDDYNIQNVLLGDNTSKQLPAVRGKGVSELYYDENNYPNADYRLITLTMDDLEYCGQIYFKNLAGLTSLIFTKLIASIGLNMGDLSNYNGILVSTIPNLATLTFTELIHATNMVLTSLGLSTANGVTLSAPKLKYLSNIGTSQGSLNIISCKINGAINFPELESIANFYLQQITGATSVLIPKLKRCLSAFSITTLSQVTTVDFTLLEDVAGNFTLKTLGSSSSPISSLLFPALKILRGNVSTFTDCNALALSMPNMVEYANGVTFSGTNRMSSVCLGTIGTLKKMGGSVILPMLGSYGLDQTSVDNMFALLASLDGVTNGTSSFGGKTLTLTGGTTPAPSFHFATKTTAGNSFTGSGTTATVVIVGHGYSTNDLLTISSNTDNNFNGTFKITKVNNDTFTFPIMLQQQPITGGGATTIIKKANSTTDTYYYKQLLLYRSCTVNNVGTD